MTHDGDRPRMQATAVAIVLTALALLALATATAALSRPLIATASDVPPSRLPMASASACSAQAGLASAPAVQRRAMLCLVNGARRSRNLPELRASAVLDRAAEHKSADILRCDEFSHEACGRDFTYWMQRFGYLQGCASAGENIAWGTGSLGSVRAIFQAWMHSAGHRENILGDFQDIGIGLRLGSLEGAAGAHVWTQDFGSRC